MGHHFGPNDPGAGPGLQSRRTASLKKDQFQKYQDSEDVGNTQLAGVPVKVPLANDDSAHMSAALEKRSAGQIAFPLSLDNLSEQQTMMAAQQDVILSDEDNELANLRDQQAMMCVQRDIFSSSQAPKPKYHLSSDEDNELANLREQQAVMAAQQNTFLSSQAPKRNLDVHGHTADSFGGNLAGAKSREGGDRPRACAPPPAASHVEPLYLDVARIPIAKDNHCLFNSISYLCCDTAQGESTARSLRSAIASGISKEPQKYPEIMLGMRQAEYCDWITIDSNWGGENEICMLCEHFNVEIQVIMMGENATSLTYGETLQPARSGRIFLLYSGQHYDALVAHQSEQSGLKTILIFPAGMSEMSSLALACGIQVFENSNNALEEVDLMMCSRLQQNDIQAQTPPQPQSAPSRYFSKEYLHRCRDRVSVDLQSEQSATNDSGAMSAEDADMMKSLKLAAELTREELKNIQDSRLMPVVDPETTAGLGLGLIISEGGLIVVSDVLELSAANFAGIRAGDVLLQINDLRIDCRGDDSYANIAKRCLGAYGSVVHLKFRRPANRYCGPSKLQLDYWVSLVREIKASKRAEVDHKVTGTADSAKTRTFRNHLIEPSRRTEASNAAIQNTPLTQQAQSDEFLQEARDFVSKSGGILEMNETISASLLAHALHKSTWRKVHVKLIPGCFLVIDKHLLGQSVVYANPLPDAAVDLQEMQIMNLQRRPLCANSQIRPSEFCFEIHLRAGTKCLAYSQQGLFEVEISRVCTFRAENARETNVWVKGINSYQNRSIHSSKDVGKRPTKAATLQHCKHLDMVQDHGHSEDSAVHCEMVVTQDELGKMGFMQDQIVAAQIELNLTSRRLKRSDVNTIIELLLGNNSQSQNLDPSPSSRSPLASATRHQEPLMTTARVSDVKWLMASVYRATEPDQAGEGDAVAMVVIYDILQERPNLMEEAIKAIKARCKDKNMNVQIIALDLLDKCMRNHGIQLQLHVMKKLLPRIFRYADPTKRECGRLCQQKSAALIKNWASLYGGRMKDYDVAAVELSRAEDKYNAAAVKKIRGAVQQSAQTWFI